MIKHEASGIKKMLDGQEIEYVVSPDSGIFDLHLKEAWNYRDLIYLFVKRNFTTLYKQTVLGPLWSVIQPLLSTVVFSIVFGRLARLTTADIIGDYFIPNFVFYMAGNICWGYISSTISAVSGAFISNAGIMSKVYYPRIIAPISTALSRLIPFFIQFAMLIAFNVFFMLKGGTDITLTWNVLLIPLLLIHMILLSLGSGMIISAFTTKYRDLTMLVGFGLQLLHYFSPVAYGLQLVNENMPGLFRLYMLNPVTPIVTTFRYAIFGFGFFDIKYNLISWLVTIILLLVGMILFNRTERTFVDTV